MIIFTVYEPISSIIVAFNLLLVCNTLLLPSVLTMQMQNSSLLTIRSTVIEKLCAAIFFLRK